MNVNVQLLENYFVTNTELPEVEFKFGDQSTIDAALPVDVTWDGSIHAIPSRFGQLPKKGRRTIFASVSPVMGLILDRR